MRTVDRRIDDGWATRKNAKATRYRPCPTGLHIALHDEDENEFVTVANLPFPTAETAREAFSIAALRYADVEADLVCDLYIDGDLIETCELWRQQIEPLRREVQP